MAIAVNRLPVVRIGVAQQSRNAWNGKDSRRQGPNGIEIRLGKHVLFQSTDEEKELKPGDYLKVLPGESVTISSYENFVFTREAIRKREGIVQSSTKVDSG
jgi:hypothetical protein